MPEFERLDFQDFHRRELPRRLAAGHGALAAADDLERIGPLAFRLPQGGSFTYRPRPGGVEVVAGDAEARTVIEIAEHDWEGIAHDLESAPGLLYAGRVRCVRGDAMRFVRWEPGLRAMYHGRPVFRPEDVDLRDRRGAPLDPTRAFPAEAAREDTADGLRGDMAHFLRTAGFLLVKGVFSPEEVERFRAHAAALETRARPGDKMSWWGCNAKGEAVLCRVTHAGREEGLRGLPTDPRLARLISLSHEDLVSRSRDPVDATTLLIKNPDMTEGLSDLPWHRDCGMGGHASMCPLLVASIFLQPGGPENGELRVLPGSHERSLGFFDASDPRAPRGVPLAAEPGDVSLHYGDIMHAAPPPTGPGPYRKCLLVGFARPTAYNHRGEGHYNDVLLSRDDGQVEHLSVVAKRG